MDTREEDRQARDVEWSRRIHVRRGPILILSLLAACGGDATPTPKAVVAVPAAIEPTDSVADYKADLLDDPVEGFVMVPVRGVKWPTLEAARTSSTPVEPSDALTAHAVVQDHGDVVEVLPAERDYEHNHCHRRDYESSRTFKVTTFVRKRDLVPVLAEAVSFAGEDDTSYTLQAGVAVVQRAGQTLAVPRDGLAFPLPPRSKLSLSYKQVKTLPVPQPDRAIGAYGYEREKPIWVDQDAKLKVGRRSFRAGSLTAEDELHVDETSSDGDEALVSLGDDCYRLTARVAADAVHVGYGGGGGMAGIGRGGGGFGVGTGRKSPPPKEHYVPEGTKVTWKGGGVAGELATAIRTYPLDGPKCEKLDQGLVEEQEVCFSPAAVKRDCRRPCKADGKCDVSGDGKRCIAAKAESCKASQGCEYYGRCSLKKGVCVAARDADCEVSLFCRSSPHACMAFEGKCMVTPNPDCANRPLCVKEGKCVADEHGVCVAASAERCAQSRACGETGACTLRGNACVAASESDCRASRICKDDGRCQLSGRRCVVKRGADCRASTGCQTDGACAAIEVTSPFGGGLAMGGMGQSPPPKVYRCGPASDADCQASKICKDERRCERKKGYDGGYHCAEP